MTIVEGIKIIGTSEHAEQYPMLSDEEIQSLADDIAENGGASGGWAGP